MAAEFYELLQIASTASAKEIRAAYLRLANEYHPDHRRHDQDSGQAAAVCFQKIQWAYVVLRDPVQRANYDRDPNRFHARTNSVHPAAAGPRSPFVNSPSPAAQGPLHREIPCDWLLRLRRGSPAKRRLHAVRSLAAFAAICFCLIILRHWALAVPRESLPAPSVSRPPADLARESERSQMDVDAASHREIETLDSSWAAWEDINPLEVRQTNRQPGQAALATPNLLAGDVPTIGDRDDDAMGRVAIPTMEHAGASWTETDQQIGGLPFGEFIAPLPSLFSPEELAEYVANVSLAPTAHLSDSVVAQYGWLSPVAISSLPPPAAISLDPPPITPWSERSGNAWRTEAVPEGDEEKVRRTVPAREPLQKATPAPLAMAGQSLHRPPNSPPSSIDSLHGSPRLVPNAPFAGRSTADILAGHGGAVPRYAVPRYGGAVPRDLGSTASNYGTRNYGYGAPNYGTQSYGTAGYGTPGYGESSYGAPSAAPGYAVNNSGMAGGQNGWRGPFDAAGGWGDRGTGNAGTGNFYLPANQAIPSTGRKQLSSHLDAGASGWDYGSTGSGW